MKSELKVVAVATPDGKQREEIIEVISDASGELTRIIFDSRAFYFVDLVDDAGIDGPKLTLFATSNRSKVITTDPMVTTINVID